MQPRQRTARLDDNAISPLGGRLSVTESRFASGFRMSYSAVLGFTAAPRELISLCGDLSF
jgi:hypothetical protein